MTDFVHEQVDSGLGYTCDKGIKDLLVAFNGLPGVRSFCSCESSKNLQWLWIEFDCTPEALQLLLAKLLEARRRFVSSLSVSIGPVQCDDTIHAHLQIPPEDGSEAVRFFEEIGSPSLPGKGNPMADNHALPAPSSERCF